MDTDALTRFVSLTLEMRAAQRAYFRDRGQEALQRSKALEREVDHLGAELEAQQSPRAAADQLDLFGGGR